MELLAIGALALAAIVALVCVVITIRRGTGAETPTQQAALNEARQATTRAETQLAGSQERIGQLEQELSEARRLRQEAAERATKAEQQLQDIEKRVSDWEQSKKDGIEAAKAAALASSRELTAALLEGHKRESEAAKKDSEQRVQKVTEELQQHFQTIVQNVHTLSRDVGENRNTVETVMRSLTNPGGAGQFAEIGLENTLKGFGLQPGRDFVLQHNTTGEDGTRLRPDAVVFLPGDAALVIDSKASKFFMELAAAEGGEAEDEAYRNVAKTMQQHLKTLADKDYATAVRDMYVSAGRGEEFRQVITAMYLPSEAAVERLDRADPEFRKRATHHQIIPIGPSGLAGLIGLASVRIDMGRQAENQEKIVEATRQLLDSVVVALGHAERVGSGLESAVKHFANFTKSINSRLLPRSRNLVGLGVRPQKHRGQMKNLSAFEVTKFDAATFIEGEVSEDEPPAETSGIVNRPRLVGQSEQD